MALVRVSKHDAITHLINNTIPLTGPLNRNVLGERSALCGAPPMSDRRWEQPGLTNQLCPTCRRISREQP